MTTIRSALAATVEDLKAAQIPDAPQDARRLMAHALGVETARLNLVLDDTFNAQPRARLSASIAARLLRKPMSHILGRREFWSHRFKVTNAVLDPRPETELLVELALNAPFSRVLDLGTGSGCILLSLLAEKPVATGLGTDISVAALEIAGQNRHALALDDRAELLQSDWFSDVTDVFDLIVSNPPYIALAEMADLAPEVTKWEPSTALTPGQTGLEAYQRISAPLSRFLAPKGRALFEIGATQGAAVSEIFRRAGFSECRLHQDLDGRDRVLEVMNTP